MKSRSLVGLGLILIFFCLPLYVGLDGWDQRNDEAIYSYAVDRILETGEWLTPRSIPTDEPFLEKPPLKFWLVAGAMRLGLLPFDDWGMRFIDAVLCTIAFIYVYGLAARWVGPLAGVVAIFVLFSFEPLMFEHGIRGNNMEGALMASYCGGIYHFLRWADETARRRPWHALAVAGYFVLAFMTKFVAAAFLPVVCLSVLIVRPSRWRAWLSRWRDWLGPAALIVLGIIPWFVYESIHMGRQFWFIIFGQHVVARFQGTLVAGHDRPWDHYFTQTWFELGLSGTRLMIVLGLVVLAYRAVRRRDWTAEALLIWWCVPFVLLSLSTSKLFYYAYPYFPPLALGAGAAASEIFDLVAGERGRRFFVRLGLKGLGGDTETLWRSSTVRRVAGILGMACLVLAVWTAVSGPVTLEIGGVRLFRNSSAVRAIVIGAVLCYFSGFGRVALTLTAAVAIAFLLPVSLYAHRVERFSAIDHPLRATRDCALAVQASGAARPLGIFWASGDLHHAYFYYLRRLGPWLEPPANRPDELQRRLEVPGEQSPVLLSMEDYVRLGGKGPNRPPPNPVRDTPSAVSDTTRLAGLPPGFSIGDVVVILLPGPYERCVRPAVEANGQELPAITVPFGGR